LQRLSVGVYWRWENIQPPFIHEEQAMKLTNIHFHLCVKMFI
jgi:hypothetical protein